MLLSFCSNLTYLTISDNIEHMDNYSCQNLIYIDFKYLNEFVYNCFPTGYEREYKCGKVKGLCLHYGGAFSIFGICKHCGDKKDY